MPIYFFNKNDKFANIQIKSLFTVKLKISSHLKPQRLHHKKVSNFFHFRDSYKYIYNTRIAHLIIKDKIMNLITNGQD